MKDFFPTTHKGKNSKEKQKKIVSSSVSLFGSIVYHHQLIIWIFPYSLFCFWFLFKSSRKLSSSFNLCSRNVSMRGSANCGSLPWSVSKFESLLISFQILILISSRRELEQVKVSDILLEENVYKKLFATNQPVLCEIYKKKTISTVSLRMLFLFEQLLTCCSDCLNLMRPTVDCQCFQTNPFRTVRIPVSSVLIAFVCWWRPNKSLHKCRITTKKWGLLTSMVHQIGNCWSTLWLY